MGIIPQNYFGVPEQIYRLPLVQMKEPVYLGVKYIGIFAYLYFKLDVCISYYQHCKNVIFLFITK